MMTTRIETVHGTENVELLTEDEIKSQWPEGTDRETYLAGYCERPDGLFYRFKDVWSV